MMQEIFHTWEYSRVIRSCRNNQFRITECIFHGLRHVCAAEWYQERIAAGATPYEARKAVSRLLGHGRDDVTKIYLASLRETRTEAPLSGAAAPSKMDGQKEGR